MLPVLLAAHDMAQVDPCVLALLDGASKTGAALSASGLTHADVFAALRPIYGQVLAVLRCQQQQQRREKGACQPLMGDAVSILRKHTLHCDGGCDRNSPHHGGDPHDPKQWNRILGEQVGYTAKLLSGKHADAELHALPASGLMLHFASDLLALYDHLQSHVTKQNDATHARWRTGLTTMVACQFSEARGALLYPARQAWAGAGGPAPTQPKKIVMAGEKRKPTQLTLFQSVKRATV